MMPLFRVLRLPWIRATPPVSLRFLQRAQRRDGAALRYDYDTMPCHATSPMRFRRYAIAARHTRAIMPYAAVRW